MASKPRVAGAVVLTLLFGNSVVATALRIIDSISRVQTVLWMKPYLDIVSLPFSIICLIVGPFSAWAAMKYERQKEIEKYTTRVAEAEAESAPIIWTPQSNWRWDEGPPPPLPASPPPFDWFWLKVLLWSGTCAVILAAGVAYIYRPKQNSAIASTLDRGQQPKQDHAGDSKTAPTKSGTSSPLSTANATTSLAPRVSNPQVPTASKGGQTVLVPLVIPPSNKREPPSGIFPEDPIKAVEAVRSMNASITDFLKSRETITFLVTWPDNDNKYLPFISTLLSDGCRIAPRQCWFTQLGGESDLDRSHFQGLTCPR